MATVRCISIFLLSLVTTALASAGGLEQTTTQLARAFSDSDPAGIRSVLSGEAKVYLAVPEVYRGERFFAADQIYYLFESFFEQNRTVRFALVTRRVDESRGTAVVRAHWDIDAQDGSSSRVDLEFALVDEAGAWRVREIRATD